MIGKRVMVRYTEVEGEVNKSVEAEGVIVDKLLVSVVQNGHTVSNDNYLIRREDGTCLLLHPYCIIKID